MAHRLARRLAAALVLASLPCGAAPRLLPAPCPDDVDAAAVTCGTVRVPEDYAARDGRHIDLYVVVVPAVQPHADAVPLVQLAGGPGLPIADTAVWLLEEGSISYAYRRERAVILVDQRGTGQSNALHCPALEARRPLQPFYPPDDAPGTFFSRLPFAGSPFTRLKAVPHAGAAQFRPRRNSPAALQYGRTSRPRQPGTVLAIRQPVPIRE